MELFWQRWITKQTPKGRFVPEFLRDVKTRLEDRINKRQVYSENVHSEEYWVAQFRDPFGWERCQSAARELNGSRPANCHAQFICSINDYDPQLLLQVKK